MIGFGFYLIGPGSYAHVPWEEGVAEVARAGFTAIDVSASAGVRAVDSTAFPPPDRARLRSIADAHAVEIAAVVTHVGLADSIRQGTTLDLPGAVDVAVDLGSPLVLVHIGGPAAPPWTPEALWTAAVDAIRAACDRAAPDGVTVALDAVARDFLTSSPAEVRRFLEDVDRPNASWNFDPAFLSLHEFDLDETVALLGPWICHAHIKDHRRPPDPLPWLVPGDGDVDHTAWARALIELGFGGVVTAEVIASPRNTPERWPLADACARSLATLRAALAAAEAAAG